jgi:hypothetical protein
MASFSQFIILSRIGYKLEIYLLYLTTFFYSIWILLAYNFEATYNISTRPRIKIFQALDAIITFDIIFFHFQIINLYIF